LAQFKLDLGRKTTRRILHNLKISGSFDKQLSPLKDSVVIY